MKWNEPIFLVILILWDFACGSLTIFKVGSSCYSCIYVFLKDYARTVATYCDSMRNIGWLHVTWELTSIFMQTMWANFLLFWHQHGLNVINLFMAKFCCVLNNLSYLHQLRDKELLHCASQKKYKNCVYAHWNVINYYHISIYSFRRCATLNVLLTRVLIGDGKTAILCPGFSSRI